MPRGRSGRPRSKALRQAILGAAYDLLADEGVGALTIEAVASRAGVGRPTVYRSWSCKGKLAVDCFRETVLPKMRIRRTGDPVADLRAHLHAASRLVQGPAGQIMRGIVAEGQRDPDTLADLRSLYFAPRREEIASLVEEAKRTGAFRPEIDAGVFADLLLANTLYHLALDEPASEAATESTLELIFHGALASSAAPDNPVREPHPHPVT